MKLSNTALWMEISRVRSAAMTCCSTMMAIIAMIDQNTEVLAVHRFHISK